MQFSSENWQEKREIENIQIEFVCQRAVAAVVYTLSGFVSPRKFSFLYSFPTARLVPFPIFASGDSYYSSKVECDCFSDDILNDKMTYVYGKRFRTVILCFDAIFICLLLPEVVLLKNKYDVGEHFNSGDSDVF